MAKISVCLQAEQDAAANIIRLVKASNGFLRAYNRSACRFHTFVNQFKVHRTFVKSVGVEVYSIGFPESMLHSLVEGRQCTVTELGYDITLATDEMVAEADYEKWAAAIPANNNTSRIDTDSLPLSSADAEREVLRRLTHFPLERKTPLETRHLQARINSFLGVLSHFSTDGLRYQSHFATKKRLRRAEMRKFTPKKWRKHDKEATLSHRHSDLLEVARRGLCVHRQDRTRL